MKTYRFKVVQGRREMDITYYRVDAETPEQAKDRFIAYMSFSGAEVGGTVIAVEDDAGTPDSRTAN